MHVYIVQPGDTLSEVAERFHVTAERLSEANDLPPAPYLLPGSALCIPSELHVAGTDGFTTVEVQPGETLRSLSERWNLPLTWLACCNHLYEGRVEAGDLLLIPRRDTRTEEKRHLPLAAMEPCVGMPPVAHALRDGLKVDAAGHLHLPHSRLGEKVLYVCSLDGPPNILQDVAKAILRSDFAQGQMLDEMALRLRADGGVGVVFQWQAVRSDVERAYLNLVREAGRRLRPMGLIVGLHLASDSPLLRRKHSLTEVFTHVDHIYYEPVRTKPRDGEDFFRKAPPPLLGLDDVQSSLERVDGLLPAAKTWLTLRPSGAFVERRRVLQPLSPHQALQFAYQHGFAISHDRGSELAWFRCSGGEGGTAVWHEDLWSMLRKLELVETLKLQGLALWESGAYLPELWEYIRGEYETRE
ncbi:LysM peptidoglycan-binding domain-containing protein [Tumebacillus sp. ITR2]|uniref:LysM peptidoglycan-binding domain-containing protein n=1 Tax=Tumebacillus amylolyticus TaxID=2801339 RepID=A0ABS1JB03_9BACL|nr:LysM peptidoglycan-binding domain-containing protein [Tumebacillus amylolyticus]MBL0387365.1 LysM peptidoglycan-binding domain-containing protein [Tumebacillus amylolyticus]